MQTVDCHTLDKLDLTDLVSLPPPTPPPWCSVQTSMQ